MKKIKNGLFVRVEYTGRLEDGELFDRSQEGRPIEFQMGKQVVIPGFEAALMGMAAGETKTFTLPPEQAYGHWDERRMIDYPKSQIPSGMEPENGKTLMLNTDVGRQVRARVVNVGEDKVSFDLNHPLAGRTLVFDIRVVGISDAASFEVCGCTASGPGEPCHLH